MQVGGVCMWSLLVSISITYTLLPQSSSRDFMPCFSTHSLNCTIFNQFHSVCSTSLPGNLAQNWGCEKTIITSLHIADPSKCILSVCLRCAVEICSNACMPSHQLYQNCWGKCRPNSFQDPNYCRAAGSGRIRTEGGLIISAKNCKLPCPPNRSKWHRLLLDYASKPLL